MLHPFGAVFNAAEDAVEMLHAAEATLEGDFATGAVTLLEKLPGAGDAALLDELNHADSNFSPKEPDQGARRKRCGARDPLEREPLAEVRFDVSHGAPERCVATDVARCSILSAPCLRCGGRFG